MTVREYIEIYGALDDKDRPSKVDSYLRFVKHIDEAIEETEKLLSDKMKQYNLILDGNIKNKEMLLTATKSMMDDRELHKISDNIHRLIDIKGHLLNMEA